MTAVDEIPQLVRALYRIVAKLESRFPDRRFTPDGHLVGSIGEVLAAHHYGLELLTASAETHDATGPDGKLVQVKATQRRTIGLSSEPEHLLVLQLRQDGAFVEVYNGPGWLAWNAAGRVQKNGQRAVGVGRLTSMMEQVGKGDRLPRVV